MKNLLSSYEWLSIEVADPHKEPQDDAEGTHDVQHKYLL